MFIKYISLFCCAILHLFVVDVECVLRNIVTDRCVHVKQSVNSSYSVLAKECSWNIIGRNRDGNGDQWIELDPVIRGERKQVTIRKTNLENLICVIVEENRIKAGMCDSASSIFVMNQLMSSNNRPVFTLEHPEGNCLTIQPGSNLLSLERCVKDDSFQQWIVCRHIKMCDVDAFWSPRGIVFRKKSTISEEKETAKGTAASSSGDPSITVDTNDKSVEKIIISEILYYVQNKFRKAASIDEQAQFISLISSFYNREEIDNGVHILISIYNETCSEACYFYGKTDKGNPSTRASNPEQLKFKVVFLINLYKTLYSMKKMANYSFVSKNITRIPEENASMTDSLLAFKSILTANIDNTINRLESAKGDLNLLFRDASPYPLKFNKPHQALDSQSSSGLFFKYEQYPGLQISSSSNSQYEGENTKAIANSAKGTTRNGYELDVRVEMPAWK